MKKKKNVIILIFAIALFIRAGVFAFVNVVSFMEDTGRVNKLEQQISELKDENNWFKYEIKDSSTDAFIEKKAREDLMLAKKGETVVYFKFNNPTAESNEKDKKEGGNFLEKMFNKLLHLFQK
jgi:cell division protein FtsB